jgi:hypothetical protein
VPHLTLHGQDVESVFQLLGVRENDITFSLGWCLTRSPALLHALVEHVLGRPYDCSEASIRLQEYESGGGVTDIEVEVPDSFFIIFEAKRGWTLPTVHQIARYQAKPSLANSKAPTKLVVVLSECSDTYAREALRVAGAPPSIGLCSWRRIAEFCSQFSGNASGERHILRELRTYLTRIIPMRRIDSNIAYVVSLSTNTEEHWSISWSDIVAKKLLYFHPLGSNWPKDPPNYLGFRHHGRLQSIHFVERYEVITAYHPFIPEIPAEAGPGTGNPHFLYRLGRPFAPSHEVRTGNLFRSQRVWCMLDTLLTAQTISEARDLTQARLDAESH